MWLEWHPGPSDRTLFSKDEGEGVTGPKKEARLMEGRWGRDVQPGKGNRDGQLKLVGIS